MTSPLVKQYLDEAADCEKRAAAETKPDMQSALQAAARRWRDLAKAIEGIERREKPPKSE
jgi:hypothetical protein